MASGTTGPAGPLIGTLFGSGTAVGLPDRVLLERFLARDAGAESAFAGLVERHGPMVLRACRDVLGDPHDADDAFQAVFLVLARRAGSIRRESAGPWLYGVALRVARCARRGAGRRREVERVGAAMRDEPRDGDPDRPDASRTIHEEIGRLPERFRSPLVLCYFEGLTHEQAAGQLGWPVGTVRSRLAWARERLRSRLTRRGLAPAAILAGTAGAGSTSAGVPAALAAATIGLAMRAAEAGAVPASVAALAGRVLRVMAMTKIKMVATGLVAVGLVASAGVGLVSGWQDAGPRGGGEPQTRKESIQDAVKAYIQPPAELTKLPPAGARREPLAAAVGSATDPPRALFVRLKSAIEMAQIRQELFRRAQVSYADFLSAQAEADALSALLEARRDEIRDQIELLQAQLVIREADVAAADAEVEIASYKLDQDDRLIRQNVVPKGERKVPEQNLAMRVAERAKRRAEVAEVRVRIAQATRQLKLVEGLVVQANGLMAKASPIPGTPGTPAPPPAR